MLELSALVAFPPCVRGADIDGEDVVRSEQSRERLLAEQLFAAAGAHSAQMNSTQHFTGSYLGVSYVVSRPEDIDLK